MQLEPVGTRIAMVGHVTEWAGPSMGSGHSYAFKARKKPVVVPLEKPLDDDILCLVGHGK